MLIIGARRRLRSDKKRLTKISSVDINASEKSNNINAKEKQVVTGKYSNRQSKLCRSKRKEVYQTAL